MLAWQDPGYGWRPCKREGCEVWAVRNLYISYVDTFRLYDLSLICAIMSMCGPVGLRRGRSGWTREVGASL